MRQSAPDGIFRHIDHRTSRDADPGPDRAHVDRPFPPARDALVVQPRYSADRLSAVGVPAARPNGPRV